MWRLKAAADPRGRVSADRVARFMDLNLNLAFFISSNRNKSFILFHNRAGFCIWMVHCEEINILVSVYLFKIVSNLLFNFIQNDRIEKKPFICKFIDNFKHFHLSRTNLRYKLFYTNFRIRVSDNVITRKMSSGGGVKADHLRVVSAVLESRRAQMKILLNYRKNSFKL